MDETRTPLRGQNCRCGACGLLFRRTSTFDAHRYGPYRDRRCYTSKELADKGWSQDSKGFWRRPGPKKIEELNKATYHGDIDGDFNYW